MTVVNMMVLFFSRSRPCADYNDGTMFVEMNIRKSMHKVDCLAVDGGYTLFIDQAIANSHLNDANFCYPIRKAKGIELTETERCFWKFSVQDRNQHLQKLAQRFKDRIIVNISKSQTWISLQCS
jgi:hypothetical protein